MSRRLIDLTGRMCGQLTVLRRAPGTFKTKAARWLCRCSCGNECVAVSCNLIKGYTRSCGCLRRRTFINNLALGRERANARRQMASAPVPVGIRLEPLLEAAQRYWAQQ
jgi:hypothetical protein